MDCTHNVLLSKCSGRCPLLESVVWHSVTLEHFEIIQVATKSLKPLYVFVYHLNSYFAHSNYTFWCGVYCSCICSLKISIDRFLNPKWLPRWPPNWENVFYPTCFNSNKWVNYIENACQMYFTNSDSYELKH